jgi:preprotein translocase subunit SecA
MLTFRLPDIGTEIANIEKKKLDKDAEAEEKKFYSRFQHQSERIHTLTLVKAYSLFEKM